MSAATRCRVLYWTTAICLFVLFALITAGMRYDMFIETDERFYYAIYGINSPAFTACVTAFTQLGGTYALVGVAALLLIVPKTRKKAGIPAALMLAASAAVNTAVKHIIQRERPNILQLVTETTYSFPSGHAMNSLVLYGTLCVILCLTLKRPAMRRAVVACACLFIALIGLSRVYLGVHYFSDMLAAFALGGALLAGAYPLIRANTTPK